jgi:hypothetical protein
MQWFLRALEARWEREVPYTLALERLAIAYSDAESTGSVAAVFVCDGCMYYMQASITRRVMRILRDRLTNIVAYELIAAILAVIVADRLLPANVGIRHFVDSKPALGCILKGSSPQDDLNSLAGYVWFAAGSRMRAYWGQYVPSKANLADAPSRGDASLLIQLGAKRVECDMHCILQAVEWLASKRSDLLVT